MRIPNEFFNKKIYKILKYVPFIKKPKPFFEETTMENNEKLTFHAKETKEVLAFAIALGKAISESLEDNEITITDLPNFFKVVQTIVPALSNIDEVAIEFAMMSKTEAEELKDFVKSELNIEDEKLDKFITQAFSVALDIWLLVNENFLSHAQHPTDEKVDEKVDEELTDKTGE